MRAEALRRADKGAATLREAVNADAERFPTELAPAVAAIRAEGPRARHRGGTQVQSHAQKAPTPMAASKVRNPERLDRKKGI
jgi:hypothetical protein